MHDRARQHAEAALNRHRAAALFAEGMSRAAVARAVGVCRATTSAWYRLWKGGGKAALTAPSPRGRTPRIDAKDLAAVSRALAASPRLHGFDLDQWSLAAIVVLIQRMTGVTHHRRHVTRVLRRMGWTVPPVGPTAAHAFRCTPAHDPDGNTLTFQERRSGP